MYFVAGEKQTGMFLLDQTYYYFDKNGVALDSTVVLDEVEMEFDNGLLIGGYTGFVKKSDGNTYHYNNGQMTFGWYQDKTTGNWYHFNADTGIMAVGSKVMPDTNSGSKGVYYDFSEEGVLLRAYPNANGYYYWADLRNTDAWVKNGYDPDQSDESWYRTNGNGHFVTDPNLPAGSEVVIEVDGVLYTFNNDNGKLLRGSVVSENGKLYYYWAGKPKTPEDGWIEDSGAYYYAFSDGHLAVGSATVTMPDGTVQNRNFASDGKLITNEKLTLLNASLTDDDHYMIVTLKNAPENAENVRIAIWAMSDQASTIRWVNAEKTEDGKWVAKEPMCRLKTLSRTRSWRTPTVFWTARTSSCAGQPLK